MSRKKSRSSRSVRSFVRALVASASTSFVVASCVLHPSLREQVAIEPLLELAGLRSPAARGEPAAATPGSTPVASYAAAAIAARAPAPAGGYIQTRFADCPQFFADARPPVVPAWPALRELCYDAFAILHSGAAKTPVFVAQRLNRDMLRRARAVERSDRFFADARLPKSERAELEDYRRSGYSRGHMAPAADMHTAAAMAQSFSLANMVPQDQRHNGGPWAKIEEDTRKYVMRAQGDVYVFTGPVYQGSSARIGRGAVAVPTHLYKLVFDAKTGRAWVHWQANGPDAVAGKPIDYEEFVRRTGLRLLPQK